MDKEISDKLKLIDEKISNALENINELEKKLSDARTDDEGRILKDDCALIREKFSSFSKSVEELLEMLDKLDLGEE